MYHQRDNGRAVRALAALCCCAAAAAAAAPAGHSAAAAVSSTKKPCDIYAAAGSPCVAAHSLVRALYGGYIGALYRVKRASDNRTAAIAVTAAGGYADASAQDAFCKGSDCVVDVIFDQSPNKNDLLVGIGGDVETGPGGRASPDLGVNASRLPITLAGRHKAYGAYVEIGMGYRTNNTDDKPCPGLATGNEPETVYMVASGTHFNGGCCFDVRSPLSLTLSLPPTLSLSLVSADSVCSAFLSGSTATRRRFTRRMGRIISTGVTKAAWRLCLSSTARRMGPT
jgi:hypothetical protein